MSDRQPLGTRPEVAAYLGVPEQTVERWATEEGAGPPYIKVGRHARYRWADVDAWLDQRYRTAPVARGGAA